MNGAHDMGGMMGFGPVIKETDEPVFHHEWEKRVMAMNVAVGAAGVWNIDNGRHARENRNPRDYLDASYYELWYLGLRQLLEDHGLVGEDEFDAGHALRPGSPLPRMLEPANVISTLARRVPYERAPTSEARFSLGMGVRAKELHPTGHTRLPRYVRGKVGMIAIVHGVHVFPDTHAHGQDEAPQWLYCVSFAATELWGNDADPAITVSADCWESYLEPV